MYKLLITHTNRECMFNRTRFILHTYMYIHTRKYIYLVTNSFEFKIKYICENHTCMYFHELCETFRTHVLVCPSRACILSKEDNKQIIDHVFSMLNSEFFMTHNTLSFGLFSDTLM
jgi:hypothetical protein